MRNQQSRHGLAKEVLLPLRRVEVAAAVNDEVAALLDQLNEAMRVGSERANGRIKSEGSSRIPNAATQARGSGQRQAAP